MARQTADVSKSIFEEAKRYLVEIAQMDKAIVDADRNDISKAVAIFLRRYAQFTLGNGSPNNGFKVMESTTSNVNNFTLMGGGVFATLQIDGSAIDGRVIYTANSRGTAGNSIRVRHNDTGSLNVDIDVIYNMSSVTGVFTIGETVTDGLGGTGTVQSVNYPLNLITIRETVSMTLGQTITGGLSGIQAQLDSIEQIDIDVSIDLGTTTALAIVGAVNGHAVASNHVTATEYGTGAQAAGAAAFTNLSGGEAESDENAGRLLGDGFPGMLVTDVDYINNNTITNDIHPIITAVQTTTLTDDTILDSSADYEINSLIGRELVPDITQPGTTYTITANTATTITVGVSMTGVAVARNHYRVNLTTPGAPRNDYVYVDMYFEEVGGADDPDLIHAFASPGESSRRWKVRQIVRVIEGYTETPEDRFTDVDGTPHARVPIATIARTATSAITQAMITDIRRDVSSFVDIKEEVIEARGSRGALGDRLSQSLAADGSVLPTAAVTALSAVAPLLVNGGAGPVTGSVSTSLPAATTSVDGYMTQAQATKLDGIATAAQVNATVEDSDGVVSVAAPTKVQFDKKYYDVTEPVASEALVSPVNGLTVAGYSAETNFKVLPATTPTNQLRVLMGILSKHDNSGFIVRLASGVAVTGISAVLTSGNERYDLVEVTDTGTIIYSEGSEVVAGPTIPDQTTMDSSVPAPSDDRSVLAIVVPQYNGGGIPAITKDHIVDARPMIRNYRASSGTPITNHSGLSQLDYASAGHTGFSPSHTQHSADRLKYYFDSRTGIKTGTFVFDLTSAGFTNNNYVVLGFLGISGGTGWLVSVGAGVGTIPSSAVAISGNHYQPAADGVFRGGLRSGKIAFASYAHAGNYVDYTIVGGATSTSLTVDGSISGSDPYPTSSFDLYVLVIGQ